MAKQNAEPLTNVFCTYTGGGIYVYHALYKNDVWILTDISDYGTYDISPAIIEEELDNDYDSHWKDVDYELPTWADILDSIRKHYGEPDCENIDLERSSTNSTTTTMTCTSL